MRSTLVLGDLLSRVTEAGRTLTGARAQESLADRCEALLGGAGEATGLAVARDILDRYRKLDAGGRLGFFRALASQFGVDRAAVKAALDAMRADEGADGGEGAARALHFASEPRSQELIRRLNRAPEGTRDLVAMRADLIAALHEAPELARLDDDFRHLFSSWFNRGFLELRSIDWSTPAAVLEKIILYEAVHEIQGWDDLRRRVAAPDRRLYAFFHPALRDDPLIFVEVALTAEIPDAIGPILAEARKPLDPRKASVATFYSISNCQAGLRGVSFGNFLIKQVVEELRREFDTLKTFATLSPAPGLRRWALAEAGKPQGGALGPACAAAVGGFEATGAAEPAAMLEIAARYYLEAKAPNGQPLDPVARFHLGNGARLERINLDADPGARDASFGVMVNYLYDLASIEKNHEAFAASAEVIAAPALRRLIRTRK